MRNEMTIPPAALRDDNAVELLRAWIAERRLQCSSRVVPYRERKGFSEGQAWGMVLADVTRHVAAAMEAAHSTDRAQLVREIRENYLKELGRSASTATEGSRGKSE
jgi:hypothetical protein